MRANHVLHFFFFYSLHRDNVSGKGKYPSSHKMVTGNPVDGHMSFSVVLFFMTLLIEL